MPEETMTTEEIITPAIETVEVEAAPAEETAPVAETAAPEVAAAPARGGRGARGGQRPGGRPRDRAPRERSEFDQATIEVRRVARVMAGGRRFSFSVTMVIGDKKGRVGVGVGKGADTALAIDKATRAARKNLVTIPLTKNNSIRHEVSTKYGASTISIIPSPGRGLVAGSAVRTVLEYAGITDVVTKILSRTKNKLTIARATVQALKTLHVAR